MSRVLGLIAIASAAVAMTLVTADDAQARHRRGGGDSCGSWGGNGGSNSSHGGSSWGGRRHHRERGGSCGSWGGRSNNGCGSNGGYGGSNHCNTCEEASSSCSSCGDSGSSNDCGCGESSSGEHHEGNYRGPQSDHDTMRAPEAQAATNRRRVRTVAIRRERAAIAINLSSMVLRAKDGQRSDVLPPRNRILILPPSSRILTRIRIKLLLTIRRRAIRMLVTIRPLINQWINQMSGNVCSIRSKRRPK